jgi:hypothetical protein
VTTHPSPLSLALVLALGVALHVPSARAAQSTRAVDSELPKPHRLIVLTDIEADPDDTQSLVRLLLYSNEIDIQGLIATTSVHRKAAVSPDSIRNVIHAYAAVYDNLLRHDSDYTEPETLLAVVKQGLPVYGMQGVGAGKDSEGSEWIIKALEQNDDRPLWVSVWGGPNTLAQALFKIRATRSAQDAQRLIAKLRVYTISDQDDTGLWMRRELRDLFYIVSPGGYGAGTWTGINHVVPGFDNTTISNRWLAENIQQGHGPLGAAYPDVAWGMEGDTPSWLSLVPNGLDAPGHPDWGGWGGRYELHVPELSTMDPNGFTGGVPVEPEVRPIWTNAVDEYRPPVAPEYGRATRNGDKSFKGFRETVWRWRDDFQNDFAARMAWTTKRVADANHPPVPVVDHPDGITVRSGQTFELSARGSTDPDGDSLSYYWFQYLEAGTCKTPLKFLAAENTIAVPLAAPKVDKEETAHVILRVTDKGTPPISRYKRVIVTITP